MTDRTAQLLTRRFLLFILLSAALIVTRPPAHFDAVGAEPMELPPTTVEEPRDGACLDALHTLMTATEPDVASAAPCRGLPSSRLSILITVTAAELGVPEPDVRTLVEGLGGVGSADR